MYGHGLIDLDASIGSYFTGFNHGNKKDLTWRSVLAHQAGLKPYIVFYQEANKKNGNYKLEISDNMYLYKRYYKVMRKKVSKSPVD